MGSHNMFRRFCVNVLDMAEHGADEVASVDGVPVVGCSSLVTVSMGATAGTAGDALATGGVITGTGSMPGTMAAGTGGGAGRGDMGSRVGNSGCFISGKRL